MDNFGGVAAMKIKKSSKNNGFAGVEIDKFGIVVAVGNKRISKIIGVTTAENREIYRIWQSRSRKKQGNLRNLEDSRP